MARPRRSVSKCTYSGSGDVCEVLVQVMQSKRNGAGALTKDRDLQCLISPCLMCRGSMAYLLRIAAKRVNVRLYPFERGPLIV